MMFMYRPKLRDLFLVWWWALSDRITGAHKPKQNEPKK